MAVIYHIMKVNYGATNVINFMEKESKERSYLHLHNAMDHQFCLLRCNGIGVERKQAEVITVEQEKQMWERDVLGTFTLLKCCYRQFFSTMEKNLFEGTA